MNKFTKTEAERLKNYIRNGDLDRITDDQMEKFMEYYMDNNTMPYGVQKARDGDPYEWTSDKIASLPEDDLIDLVYKLTENDSIAQRFEKNLLNEGLTFKQRQLQKSLDLMLDQLEKMSRMSEPTSNVAKNILEMDGDHKALALFHKKIDDAYDDLTDILMSCFSETGEN